MSQERVEFGQVLDGLFLGAMEGLKDDQRYRAVTCT